ncbi:MAG TPA: hypothetical protein VFB67_03535 [Candidatus Polarisedimenticolaceae bacterium]|nr:hypothetical protein [Candidatus Polarisedimenticolaceae bacterium]
MLAAIVLTAALSPFDQVVAAERAFAAASLAHGQHTAFLEYLTEDAIAFEPVPTPARPLHEGKPNAGATLTWGPSWVAVASAGDLAISTGPWELRRTEEPRLKMTGWFFSIWRREPGGAWKVAVDSGISTSLTFAIPSTVTDGAPSRGATAPGPAEAARARGGIMTAERKLGAAAAKGLGAAVLAQADHGIRVYRADKAPSSSLDDAKPLLASDLRRVSCVADRVVGAAGGDLGYAYGTCADASPGANKLGFLRVWRKDAAGAWKVLADVTP